MSSRPTLTEASESQRIPTASPTPSTDSKHASDNSVKSYLLSTSLHPNHVEHRVPWSSRSRGIRRGLKKQQWRTEKGLGRGGFGIVHLPTETGTGKVRAVKEILRTTPAAVDPLRELTAMAALSKVTSFMFPMLDTFRVRANMFLWIADWQQGRNEFRQARRLVSKRYKHLYIAMEYLEHGDLKQCVPGALTEEAAQNITFQVTEALQFMHVRSFAHRDLKPSVSHSIPVRDPC